MYATPSSAGTSGRCETALWSGRSTKTPDVLLEGDDVGRVRAGGLETRRAEAAHALVEPVERSDRGELDLARVDGERRGTAVRGLRSGRILVRWRTATVMTAASLLAAPQHIGPRDDSGSSARTNRRPPTV